MSQFKNNLSTSLSRMGNNRNVKMVKHQYEGYSEMKNARKSPTANEYIPNLINLLESAVSSLDNL